MDEQDLTGIAQTHVPDPVYGGKYCIACGPAHGRMPCDAVLLLAEVRRYRAALAGIRKRYADAAGRQQDWGVAWAMDDDARAALAAEATDGA